jgi:hypothetical protein
VSPGKWLFIDPDCITQQARCQLHVSGEKVVWKAIFIGWGDAGDRGQCPRTSGHVDRHLFSGPEWIATCCPFSARAAATE